MSTRTYLAPQLVVAAGDMSGNITSHVTILRSLTMASFSVVWSGTSPVGTISVQASDDYALNPDGSVANAGTWNSLPLDVAGVSETAIPVSGNSGNGMIDIDGLSAYAIRLIYTAGSGVGTLMAIFTGKVA